MGKVNIKIGTGLKMVRCEILSCLGSQTGVAFIYETIDFF